MTTISPKATPAFTNSLVQATFDELMSDLNAGFTRLWGENGQALAACQRLISDLRDETAKIETPAELRDLFPALTTEQIVALRKREVQARTGGVAFALRQSSEMTDTLLNRLVSDITFAGSLYLHTIHAAPEEAAHQINNDIASAICQTLAAARIVLMQHTSEVTFAASLFVGHNESIKPTNGDAETLRNTAREAYEACANSYAHYTARIDQAVSAIAEQSPCPFDLSRFSSVKPENLAGTNTVASTARH